MKIRVLRDNRSIYFISQFIFFSFDSSLLKIPCGISSVASHLGSERRLFQVTAPPRKLRMMIQRYVYISGQIEQCGDDRVSEDRIAAVFYILPQGCTLDLLPT